MTRETSCPGCGAPVRTETPTGRPPNCKACREAQAQRRLALQRERRRAAARPTHRTATCVSCGTGFLAPIRRGSYVRHCDTCYGDELARREDARYAARRARYASADSADRVRRRLAARLKKFGLDLAWFDAQQGRCGICETTEPGVKGWSIDHDHSCCPKGQGCVKCVRGILCGRCNTGLGLLGDDPARLRKAALWVER